MLTREKVLSMKPGRELDALVAEKVMSWRHVPSSASGNLVQIEHFLGHDNEIHVAWMPSEDISAAWEVVEKMLERGGCEIGCYGSKNGAKWFEVNVITMNGEVTVTAHTAHEAICKATLLAVMEE